MTEQLKQIFEQPIFFERNRVFRVYQGGKLFADFFGTDKPEDSNYPEEWVSSTVKAMNENCTDPTEGLSKLRGTSLTLKELIEQYPSQLLGNAKNLEVLVKILDSAVRLPVQAHPDKAFSAKYFHSPHGKAECWIVLATRENAKLYFGFNRKVSQEEFTQAVEKSRIDKTIMAGFLNEIDAKAGDVYFIPANFVHAIGYGCLILEVQEPTDFTVQPERYCGDYELSDYEMYLNLDKKTAMDVFCYDTYGPQTLALSKKEPRVISNTQSVLVQQLIGEQDTDCFGINRYTLTGGEICLLNAPAVCVITQGCGKLHTGNRYVTVKKGDYFFLPHLLAGKSSLSGHCQMVECLPQKQ